MQSRDSFLLKNSETYKIISGNGRTVSSSAISTLAGFHRSVHWHAPRCRRYKVGGSIPISGAVTAKFGPDRNRQSPPIISGEDVEAAKGISQRHPKQTWAWSRHRHPSSSIIRAMKTRGRIKGLKPRRPRQSLKRGKLFSNWRNKQHTADVAFRPT